ncbi:MAG: ABC transporter ATP-binding protein, partial [Clostridia bacterium]|nr:ABC transporter ATP-binding protein [Clostridia bacterium]
IAKGVFTGAYEIGNYSLYTDALTSISNCVNNFISYTSTIYEGTLFINNMITFMDEKPTIVPSLEKPRDVKRHCGHSFVFENVSFRYPGGSRDVIKNLNMTINAGDTVVLVGLNGAGKTTLIKLLTRLYDPTEGRILLDGCDIKEYDVKQLYAMFGIIFQDFGKYAVSVRENIEFGDINKKPDEKDITSAAFHSNADSFIDKLPDKYDTPLMRYFEENGTELSIGQWQKLAIARAFFSDSDVLILDEPTASLDPMAEQEIFNQFDELREDKTTVFVSHRLSSATTADKIAVIEGGELVEFGSHEELMALRGKYYLLFSTQAKRYIEGQDREETKAPPMRSEAPRREE